MSIDRSVPPPEGVDDATKDWIQRNNDSQGVFLLDQQAKANRTYTGRWTPQITFATPGDLSVTYQFNEGNYVRDRRIYTLWGIIKTTAFTYTTASGNLIITGIPKAFSAYSAFYQPTGNCAWSGITLPAGYGQINVNGTSGGTSIFLQAFGSASSILTLTTTHVPTTSTVNLRFELRYIA